MSGVIKSPFVGIYNAFQENFNNFEKNQDFAPKHLCAKFCKIDPRVWSLSQSHTHKIFLYP